jgi:hypothetical protein
MNKFQRVFLVAGLCVAAAASARAQNRDERRGGGAVRSRPAAVARPRAPQPMRVSPNTRLRPSGTYRPPAVRYDIKPAPGRYGGAGVRPAAAVFRAPNHTGIVGRAGFSARVFVHENDERLVNHPYWHTDNNVRYAHMYDGHIHWYGFYNGPRFYWTRYEDNRWWWFDQAAGRWLYWYDNYWWWHNPANPAIPYVVINDSYYPYSDIEANPQLAPGVTSAPAATGAASQTAMDAPPSAPPTAPQTAVAAAPSAAPSAASQASADAAPPAAPQTGDDAVRARAAAAMTALDKAGHGNRSFVSPDATREVRIYGDQHEAFLYDRTGGGAPRFIGLLASGARRAQFSETSSDHLQILLLMHDGSYDVFDADGHSLLQSAAGDPAAPSGADATPAPPSAPPIPAQ